MYVNLLSELNFGGSKSFPATYYIVPFAVHPDDPTRSVDLPFNLNVYVQPAGKFDDFALESVIDGRENLYHPAESAHTEESIQVWHSIECDCLILQCPVAGLAPWVLFHIYSGLRTRGRRSGRPDLHRRSRQPGSQRKKVSRPKGKEVPCSQREKIPSSQREKESCERAAIGEDEQGCFNSSRSLRRLRRSTSC